MGRQSEPAVHSSIALLQERFRRLQRARELRQEREVLLLLSEAERIKSGTPNETSQSFFHSELMLKPTPHLQGSAYGESGMRSMHNRRQVIETPIFSNLQQKDTVLHTFTFNDSDVDTSSVNNCSLFSYFSFILRFESLPLLMELSSSCLFRNASSPWLPLFESSSLLHFLFMTFGIVRVIAMVSNRAPS
ncbi:putative metal ion binding protein [Hibiscus syriacus]|uniref:Metal ion binding protein n=1 Tax=Hibiscus syriacus TaxID=106335 RepID=A0A6A2YLB2_HIBSY|nr:putative metal ion binding protein [Hibiscus syriacus]